SSVIKDGSVRAEVHGTFSPAGSMATYSGDLKGIELDLGSGLHASFDTTVRGRAKSNPDFDVVELEELRFDASRFAARGPGGAPRGTWLAVQVPRLMVSGSPACAAFAADVQGGNASPLGAVAEVGPLRPTASEALHEANMRGRLRVRFAGSSYRLDVEQANVGLAEARGIVVKN